MVVVVVLLWRGVACVFVCVCGCARAAVCSGGVCRAADPIRQARAVDSWARHVEQNVAVAAAASAVSVLPLLRRLCVCVCACEW